MSTARPYSQDQRFEQLLLALYRHWYALPRRSTLPALDTLRAGLARDLEHQPEPRDVTRYEQALIDFARAAVALPGTAAAGGEQLRRLAGAEPFSVRSGSGGAFLRSDLSETRVAALVALLRAADPAMTAIAAMHFPPQQAATAWAELWATLAPALPRFSPDVQAQVRAIDAELQTAVRQASTHRARTDAYLAALGALERIPAVVRVTSGVLVTLKTLELPDSQRAGAYGPEAQLPLPPLLEGETSAVAADSIAGSKGIDTPAIEFQVGVHFPPRVKRGETTWLRVTLLIDFPPETPPAARVAVPFVTPARGGRPAPEIVEVRLAAPDFDEETGCWDRSILVYPDRNSQPAVFLLAPKPDRGSGRRRIAVDFLHRGRPLGSVSLATEVVDGATVRSANPVTLEGELAHFAQDALPAADLEIRVVKGENGRLNLLLNSAREDVPLHNLPVGELDLAQQDPQRFITQHLERLSQLAAEGDPATAPARIVEEVERIGEILFEVLPPGFQEVYWGTIVPLQQAGKLRTLLVYSDEPWIPWELLKPYRWDSVTDTESRAGFFAEDFAMSRWLTGRGPATSLAVRQAALVLPELDLAHAKAEKRFFDTLAQTRGLAVAPPLQRRDELLAMLQTGGFQVLHVATHGNFNRANVEQSELSLVGGGLRPVDLGGSGLRGVRQAQPLVFLNACYSGQVEYSLVGLGGWAQKFCAVRVSAFVGTLWEVSDELAAHFSQAFYRSLVEGKTLGEAMLAARSHIRQLAPANPTWLAYTLYGDPNARVRIGDG